MGQTEEEAGMSVDNRTLFSGRAQDYERARPDYAPQLVNALYARYGFSARSRIADVGAGTGKLTGMLLARGSTVYAVEPNADMRAACAARLHGYRAFTCVAGDASHTGLPAGSVDIVTAAQAFHWFDAAAFRRECLRILRPGGRVFLVWNNRVADAPVNVETFRVFRAFCPGFRGASNGFDARAAAFDDFFGGPYERLEFPNPLTFSQDSFLRRAFSASYALPETHSAFPAYRQALYEVFDRFAADGLLAVPNVTEVYAGVLRAD